MDRWRFLGYGITTLMMDMISAILAVQKHSVVPQYEFTQGVRRNVLVVFVVYTLGSSLTPVYSGAQRRASLYVTDYSIPHQSTLMGCFPAVRIKSHIFVYLGEPIHRSAHAVTV